METKQISIGKSYNIVTEADFIYATVKDWLEAGDQFINMTDDGGMLRSKKRVIFQIEKKRGIAFSGWHSFKIKDSRLFFMCNKEEYNTSLSQLGFYVHYEMRD